MDYEKEYKEALEKIRKGLQSLEDGTKISGVTKAFLEEVFPELKESEDEKIRKEIYRYFRDLQLSSDREFSPSISIDEILAWLEKQNETSFDEEWIKLLKNANIQYQMSMTEDMVDDAAKLAVDGLKKLKIYEIVERYIYKRGENKSVGNVEPKFKIGDWVVNKLGDLWHIDSFDKKNYQVSNGDKYNYFPISKQNEMHLWTIRDAEDGDVLATKKSNPFIYDKNRYNNRLAYYYAGLDVNKELTLKSPHHMLAHFGELRSVFPATKEQRDLLFQKMKEAGYEWDADKKELKRIKEL